MSERDKPYTYPEQAVRLYFRLAWQLAFGCLLLWVGRDAVIWVYEGFPPVHVPPDNAAVWLAIGRGVAAFFGAVILFGFVQRVLFDLLPYWLTTRRQYKGRNRDG